MIKGKGAQFNPSNPYLKQQYVSEHPEGIDVHTGEEKPPVEIYFETVKNPVSKNDSPDLAYSYSVNPYQGCEHGCIYCYARNSHTYWGFSAGLDFESKIIVKKDVAAQLERKLQSRNWKCEPIMLSGNTDCYQPLESRFQLTREILKVALKYRQPVSIITKNALIKRDEDLLTELASLHLVHVYFSITSLNEKLRSLLEPRTATYNRKLELIAHFTNAGIPVGVMNAPIIPGLTHHEIPSVLKAAADHGALAAGYTVVRLNGQLGDLFRDWLRKTFPDRASKVENQISELHEGKMNDTEWGRRLKGEGNIAQAIQQLFRVSHRKYFEGRKMPPLDTSMFRRGGNYQLF